MIERKTLRGVALGAAGAAIGFAAAMAIVQWGSAKAPEFYGSFTAAVVAAVAVILGSYYQADLTRRRDEELRDEERVAEAIDLCFWLQHASREIEFIESVLREMREALAAKKSLALEMPLEQFRTAISAQFFEEILQRAKAASGLPAAIGAEVTRVLYDTYRVSDRILLLRGASDDYRPSVEALEKYLFVVGRRRRKLQLAADMLMAHLIQTGAMAVTDGFDDEIDDS